MAELTDLDSDSPLIKALPPASDYLTYLTIIEYNLTLENLPVLHRVLQDETLSTNIGWDLVHLLVPLLPESEQCLHDVSRLGNPREVILKVTECLRLIEYSVDEEDLAGGALSTDDVRERAASTTYPHKTAPTTASQQSTGSTQMVEIPPPLPLPVQQFVSLLSMISILHTRIKTKNPSRFLSTTLQAILASFSNSNSHREPMVDAIVKTVKAMGAIRRPALPSRTSSGSAIPKAANAQRSAADPEGSADAAQPSPEETQMQLKLLQSFITHVIEEYLLNLEDDDDAPGLAWCSRLMEKIQPGRTVPDTATISQRFEGEQKLRARLSAVGQLVALAKDLGLKDNDLLTAAITVEKASAATQEEADPPSSAEDVPLSRLGSLLLFTARQLSEHLYDTPNRAPNKPFTIFPGHNEVLKTCLSSHANGTGQLGTEPAALVDAILALGFTCLEKDAMGEPASDDQFTEYLQVTALLSSNCSSPNLRGHAHYLTTTVLRSQPDDNVRLGFIRDTLEHCPFENLKVSAVGWIKGETVEANPHTPVPGASQNGQQSNEESSIFATPLALDSLAPFLFPSVKVALNTAPVLEAWQTFQTNISFYLASLNFVYLLLCAKHLHHTLGVADIWKNSDIAGSFIQPLKDASNRFKQELKDDGALAQEKDDHIIAELTLLDETVDRVTRAVPLLNES